MALLHRIDKQLPQQVPTSLHTTRQRTLNRVAVDFLEFAHNIIKRGSIVVVIVSPLTLQWGYTAARHFIQLAQEGPNLDAVSSLETCHQVLHILSIRWQSAGMDSRNLRSLTFHVTTPLRWMLSASRFDIL